MTARAIVRGGLLRFVDTNILLYAISPNPVEAAKQRIAKEILIAEDLALSVQVIQEFYCQATRPARTGAITHLLALEFIDSIGHIRVQNVTFEIFCKGVSISQRFHISYWDGAILAAAKVMSCTEIFTEDLNHEQAYDGVTAINPFIS
ncbi:MAG: PIN domain-containing protein [Acidiferrobacterales bacterium]|nr:PIN domain-containing protein [Acidiferrobacterales bacterium]